MTDCMNKELSIGDKVVCSDMKYADLLVGEVIGFTNHKIRVSVRRSEFMSESQTEQLKYPYQVFKYEEK